MNNLLSIFKRILICVFALILAVSGSFTVKAETPEETDFTESSELTAEETQLPEKPAETASVNADNIIPNEGEICILTGETSQLTYTLEPSDATETPVWSSMNPNCVSVDENGIVSAVSAGYATVTAAIANGNEANYGVFVIDQQPDSISFDSVDISINEGESENVSLYVYPESSQYCKKYVSSSNSSVAYAGSDVFYGTDLTLYAQNAGQTTVTVTTENGLSTSITVIVNSKSEAEYSITTTEPVVGMKVGESRYLDYSISPDDGTQTVTWGVDYIDNNCILMGHNGMVEAQDYGTARVYAEISNGNRQYYDIYVSSRDPESFSMPSATYYMQPYWDKYFSINISPWQAQFCRKHVVSDNPSAIKVNEEYVYNNYISLTSFGSGSANITVTADNGVSTTFTVNVFNGTPADRISSNETTIGLKVGESKQLAYTLEPSNADEKPVWYDTWNNDCVSVDENGVVTALDNGYTCIVAELSNNERIYYYVYVTKTDPRSFSFDRDYYKVGLNNLRTIYFNVIPWESQYCRKTITSSDPSVLRVDHSENSEYIYDAYANVYGVSTGTATLTVTADNGVSRSVEVEVVSGNFADSISSSETEIAMTPGESRQLTYTLSPETADEVPVFRLSYDTDIINVDKNGVVTANKTGNVEVIAELINGSTVYYYIHVTEEPDSMQLRSYNDSYIVGTNASNNLSIITTPNSAFNCHKHVTSSNPEIVRIENEWTFSTNVNYYGVSEGKATITVEADNGVSASVDVEVIDGLASYINISGSDIYMKVGDSQKIPYTLEPSSATEIPEISVNKLYKDIVSVDENGVITALKAGHAYVNLKLRNGAGNSVHVFVADSDPQTIRFKQSEYAIVAGSGMSLADQLVYDPPGSKYNRITCTSSDPSIVSVTSFDVSPVDLYLNGYNPGEATITVTSENGISASTKIKVIGGYASRITATNGSITLKPGETEELQYKLDSEAGDISKESVTFEIITGSENISFENGKVTALKPGRAVVEARSRLYYGLPDELSEYSNYYRYNYKTVFSINITEEPSSLEFDKNVYQAKINEEVAGFVYSDSADSELRKLTYTSSDASVATVYSYGQNFVITGIGAGTAVITATAENGVSAQAQIVVSDETFVNDQYHIEDNYFNWLHSVKVGEEVDLSSKIKDMNNQTLDYSKVELVSDNPAVLSVSGSVIKGVSAGLANLHINNKESSDEQRNTIIYSVLVTDTDRISFEQSEYTVSEGDTILLRKILKTEPVNYTMQEIEFTASDPDVAAIFSDWMDWKNLYAVKTGDTVITATTKDGKTAQMTLHVVNEDPYNDLILNEDTPIILHKNYEKTLKLNGPSYEALKSYKLTTADNHIVSILSDNTLFGLECGTTTITATLKTDNTKQLSIPVTVVDGDTDTYAYSTVLRKLNGDKDSFETGDEFTCYVGEQYMFSSKAQWTDQYGEEHPYYDPLYGKGYETENNSIIPLTFGGGMGWASGPSAYGNSSKYMQFMAIRPGTSRIYTTGNRYVTIHVVEPVASLTISAPKTDIYAEETLQLSAEIESEIPVTDPVSWKSSDTSVLTVDETGKVTGVSAGKATVTARAGRLRDSIEITVIGPLEAELIAADEIYAAEPTVLKATATGGSAPYKYQFTAKIDGKWTTLHNGTESECTYTFEKAGSYPVNVTVTDSAGTRVKSQKTLTVEVRPSEDPLAAELVLAEDVYAGEATVLKATATGGSAPYKYQFTAKIDGKWIPLQNGTESECTYTFEKAGSYPVNVTVTDSTGARVKSQKTLTVTVRPSEDPLAAEIQFAEDVYAGEATVLKATATGGSAPYKYQFTAKIDGKWTTLHNGTESECTYTFEKAGSYPVNVTVTDSTGARVKSQKTLTVEVRPSEDPLAAEIQFAEDVYAGEATVLKAVATGGSAPYKYQFTAKIDGKWTTLKNGTESECTYTFEKAGSYPVNVTVTDSAGTRVKSQKTLRVLEP